MRSVRTNGPATLPTSSSLRSWRLTTCRCLLRDACVETFGLRGKHPWPPTVVPWPGWDDIWDRLVETERLDYSIAEAVARVQDLVGRIDSARDRATSGLESRLTSGRRPRQRG